MCKSKAEGGRRCRSHTEPKYLEARAELARLGGPDVSDKARERYVDWVEKFASVREGRSLLAVRAEQLRLGAPAEGDILSVIEAAVARRDAEIAQDRAKEEAARAEQERARAVEAAQFSKSLKEGTPWNSSRASPQKPSQAGPPDIPGESWELEIRNAGADLQTKRSYETGRPEGSLQRSMWTGEPVEEPAKRTLTSTRTPVVESVLAEGLRTGALRCVTEADLVDPSLGPPVAYGDVLIHAGQEALVERWGDITPTVTWRPDVRNDVGGWEQVDALTTHLRKVESGYRGWADTRVHGTLIAQDPVTGERVGLRAVQDPETGVLTIIGLQQ